MRDFALAPRTISRSSGGLADSVFERAELDPTLPVLARRPEGSPGNWQEVTAVELRDEVVDLAKGLVASGISPGHRVAIMARTPYQWTGALYTLSWRGAG